MMTGRPAAAAVVGVSEFVVVVVVQGSGSGGWPAAGCEARRWRSGFRCWLRFLFGIEHFHLPLGCPSIR